MPDKLMGYPPKVTNRWKNSNHQNYGIVRKSILNKRVGSGYRKAKIE
jgi:hypothetical protein